MISSHDFPLISLKSPSFPRRPGTAGILRSRRLGTEAAQQTLAALDQLHAVAAEATQDLVTRWDDRNCLGTQAYVPYIYIYVYLHMYIYIYM